LKTSNFPPHEKKLVHAERQSATTNDKAHGRSERRTLVSSTGLNSFLEWPCVAQAFKLTRRRTYQGKTESETLYGITSLRRDQASARDLLRLVRTHWGIENSVFHVRDVTLGEDQCRVRTGTAPHILSDIRNIILNLLHRIEGVNIAATLRRHAAHPLEALRLLTG
jgi:predicted transposase YbfD/YdcC